MKKPAKSTPKRRTVARVTYDHDEACWKLTFVGQISFKSQLGAVAEARWICRAAAGAEGPMAPDYVGKDWTQYVVHNKSGEIVREGTFPRSSDPKRHKG